MGIKLIAVLLVACAVSACATTGVLPTEEVPPLVVVDEAELQAGMPNVRKAVATRIPFRGTRHIALDVPLKGNLKQEYRLCYVFTYAVHSNMIAQAGAGGLIQAIEDGLQRFVHRAINKASLNWPLMLADAGAGAIAGGHSAAEEETRLFFNDVRLCTMRRTGKEVYIANVPVMSP